MNNYKIKVNDEAESKEAQELFKQLDVTRHFMDKVTFPYWLANDGVRLDSFFIDFSDMKELDELTLPQLRDLVAQSKSNVREYIDPNDNYKLCLINPSDATHWMIDVPKGAELYVYWPLNGDHNFQSGQSFYKDGIWNPCSFSVEEIKKGDAGAEILWSREPIQDQGLISGREALERIAEGVVQYKCSKDPVADRWTTITDHFWNQYHLGLFLNQDTTWSFRLKPRTIKLELEIPAPFEPKMGETYYFLTTSNSQGFDFTEFDDSDGDKLYMQLGAYKTASDARKAVAALRGIKG